MSTEESMRVASQFFETIGKRDLAALTEMADPECVGNFPGLRTSMNREQLIASIAANQTAFPDLKAGVEDQFAEGDKVVSRTAVRVTHLGPYYDIPPTGKNVSWWGLRINRVVGGKIMSRYGQVDMLNIVHQMGGMPLVGRISSLPSELPGRVHAEETIMRAGVSAEDTKALVRRVIEEGINLGKLAPSGEVFAEVNERMRRGLIIAGIGIGIGLIIAWLVAHNISKPIRVLTNEAFQMRTFDLSDRPPVRSRIVEVERLSQAVQTLKRAMADFGRYVPTQLVRRLVSGEMTAEIGGERREVTLLFTDIADFTSISEDMEPSTLMQEVSEYLAEASGMLIEHGATIDKYIGDAIMAMWNAPVDQENHVELACRAALKTAAVIDSLNERRTAEGRPPFRTRFGLHVGEVVVGNVGSDERMNYTALGETVNLASRLEGLNKQLGTDILVSEAVMGTLSEEFVARPVDMVRVKGTTHPVRVFELVSPGQYTKGEGTKTHLESGRVCYTSYTERRWADAVADFDRHIQAFPTDDAAKVLRARAAAYKDSPPPEDWDGVFEAQSK